MRLLFLVACCFLLTSCGTIRKVFGIKEKVDNVTDHTKNTLGKFRPGDFIDDPPKPKLKRKRPVELPAPNPPRSDTLQSKLTGLEHNAGDLYDRVTAEVLIEADEQIEEKLNSNSTLSSGQSWLFYLIGAGFIVAAGVFLALKTHYTAICCAITAFGMCLLPTMIEAIHDLLKGLVWAFYALLAIGVLSLVGWLAWKLFKHDPKKKDDDLKVIEE